MSRVQPAQRTATEQRTVDVEVEGVRAEGRTLKGHAAVFNVLSEDLGGFRERILPGAFAGVLDDDVRLLVDHNPPPLARTKAGTLRLHEDERGLAFEADLPDTTAARDLRESVARGDVDGASFRFVIGEETWQDDVRTIVSVAQLRDVTVATYPAYPAASIELRSNTSTGGERRQKGATMDPQNAGAETAENTETEVETSTETTETEQRSTEPTPAPAGSLRVEERTSAPVHRGLADEFRSAGFPGESAEIPWERYDERALTWSPSVNLLGQIDRQAGAFPFDQRYAWTALDRESVDSATTSVISFVQTATDAATGVVRAIDATSPKAEVSTTLDLDTTALKCVAAVQSDIPTIVLAQPAVDRVINRDLAMAVNDGLDELVLDTFTASGYQTPGANHVISIRKAMTTLYAGGFNPDLVILTPAAAEELDLLVSGIADADADFTFAPGQFAPELFNLRRVISKGIPASVVLDSRSYARLYVSPAQLTTHEQDGGLTNKSRVRLELNAACAVERQNAAVRIAAS